MGLFDFVFHIGAKFTRDEIKILDMNFNSISAYTKKNYRFFLKDVGNNILASDAGGHHRIDYRHQDIDTDEFNRDHELYIRCYKYLIRGKREYDVFVHYIDPSQEDENTRINTPKIKKFPTSILVVGYGGHGFAVEFKYNYENLIDKTLENSDLTKECISEIKSCAIKYLKDCK